MSSKGDYLISDKIQLKKSNAVDTAPADGEGKCRARYLLMTDNALTAVEAGARGAGVNRNVGRIFFNYTATAADQGIWLGHTDSLFARMAP